MNDAGYCGDPAKVTVYPGAAEALQRLRARGFRLIVVTNQSGIGRGYFSEDDYQLVQLELAQQLGAPDLLDAVYHCPDAPERSTDRRKPAPGMILEAAREHGVDLSRSYTVGDSARDLEAGRRAGLAAGVLVLTGNGREQLARCQPDFAAENLTQAADWILRHAAAVDPAVHG